VFSLYPKKYQKTKVIELNNMINFLKVNFKKNKHENRRFRKTSRKSIRTV